MLDMGFSGLMFTECGNLELLGRRKRGRTQRLGVTKEDAMNGWRQIILIIRLPVIVFDDTEAIYQ